MKLRILLFGLLLSLFFWSCKNDVDDFNPPPEPPVVELEKGLVTGTVTSANGTQKIGGATVFVLEGEDVYHTYSDAEGNFNLEAPEGLRTVHIQTGNGSNFRTAIDVEITKDQTVAIEATASRLDQVANMAYVTGAFDEIQLVINSLGYTADEISYLDLSDYNIISQYDIIFLNCGSNQHDYLGTDASLSAFVSNGGSLYTSDWAVSYLIGASPTTDICTKEGGFVPDDKLCTQQSGPMSTITDAEIVDGALAASMGYSSLDIEYDLDGWDEIVDVDLSYWDVLVSDPATHGPLMIRTNDYSDPDAVTTPVGNAANGWITICHYPPGNPDNPVTITINENAWDAHEDHGDTLGECDGATSNGNIYFTTFHTHAGGLNHDNSEDILEYVILNL